MDFNFTPLITITPSAQDGQVLVVFDSNSALDVTRRPNLVSVPWAQFKQLAFDFEGFTSETANESGDVKMFSGKVLLKCPSGEDGAAKIEVADISLKLKAKGRAKKKVGGVFEFPSQQEVQNEIRHGLAKAAASAMFQYASQPQLPAAVSVDSQMHPSQGTRSSVSRVVPMPALAAANDGKATFRRNLIVAAVAGPLLVFAVIGVTQMSKPADPIQQAVADAMAHSPAAANAQVDLVKQTLKEMNLDPGNGGDTGCLAQ